MLFAFLNKGNLQLQFRFPSAKFSPKIKCFSGGYLEQEPRSFLFPFVFGQSFLFACKVELAYPRIILGRKDPPGGVPKLLLEKLYGELWSATSKKLCSLLPCCPHFCLLAYLPRLRIGSTSRLEITSKEKASSLILVCLLSVLYSVVDKVYIKCAKCESGFKKVGFKMGQEFLTRQPDNRRQCLKL